MRVAATRDDDLPAGDHTAVWDGTDTAGRAQPSGGYVFRLSAGGESRVVKALLLR